jgi:hypothetical protein
VTYNAYKELKTILYPKKACHFPSEKLVSATFVKSPENKSLQEFNANEKTVTITKKGMATFKKFGQNSGCCTFLKKLMIVIFDYFDDVRDRVLFLYPAFSQKLLAN